MGFLKIDINKFLGPKIALKKVGFSGVEADKEIPWREVGKEYVKPFKYIY